MVQIDCIWREKNGDPQTKPKLMMPFKCYIYEAKGRTWQNKNEPKMQEGRGAVIGEFVCYNIVPIEVLPHGSIRNWMLYDLSESCVPYEEMAKYIGYDNTGYVWRTGYGWKITELKIYDKPKPLSEFKRWSKTEENVPCSHVLSLHPLCKACKAFNLNRPPQSWCYVDV